MGITGNLWPGMFFPDVTRISVISQPFWLFLGSFRWVNPCGLRVRVDAGAGTGQAELPVGYPRQSLSLASSVAVERRLKAVPTMPVVSGIGIVAGNPRVTQPGPHPYPHLPVPATRTGLPIETSPKRLRND